MNQKLKIYLVVFMSSIFLCSSLLYASEQTVTPSDIKHYTNDLLLIQNQIFSLAQYAIFPTDDTNAYVLENSFNNIDKSLDVLAKDIYTDLVAVSNQSPYINNLRLLLNATNYMHNALYELNTILKSTDSTDKMLTLERYFAFRINAKNTFALISSLLADS